MKDFLVLISAVVVVIVFGLYVKNAPEPATLAFRPIDVGGGSITVEDQPEMNRVVLETELVAPGFITIHETLAGNVPAPADIIGTSRYLEEGVHEDLAIDLDVEMTPGFRYIAILHADNGDERFVVEDDLPVMTNDVVVRPDFIAAPPGQEDAQFETDLPADEDSGEDE